MLLCQQQIFSKKLYFFFKKLFKNNDQSVSLDLEQAHHSARPDLGLNHLQRLSILPSSKN